MYQPISDRPTVTPDQIAAPTPEVPTTPPIALLDACGNGYTAADLARALAASAELRPAG